MNLFERVIELKVGETEITGLDISFEIEKDETPEPNPCHVEIYNLGPENRATLSKYKYVPVLLKAGYKGQVGVIFQGDMIRCTHSHDGHTWKTVLANGEGVMAMQTKRINKNYAKGTLIKTVVEDLAKEMGLPLTSAIEQLSELNQSLSKGFAASGNPIKDLCRIFSGKPINVSVQNHSVQLRRKSEPLQREAISVSANTGLIGSPELSTDGKILVRSLLMAEFAPGRRIHIDSSLFKGIATIHEVRFAGANFGNEWMAEMKCKT